MPQVEPSKIREHSCQFVVKKLSTYHGYLVYFWSHAESAEFAEGHIASLVLAMRDIADSIGATKYPNSAPSAIFA